MKTAVVLFNLGGPDRIESVRPFLFNLFNDRAIISVPQPMRWILAKLISKRRGPVAEEIYRELGGGSPLLENTQRQAEALEKKLQSNMADREVRVFIAMRYWHPFAFETVKEVKGWGADEVVLLPLYPQFSTTTSASSIEDWKREATKAALVAETKAICCYPEIEGFLEAALKDLRRELETAPGFNRVLFSAHGLPKKIIEKGDPYQWQVERSAQAVVDKLALTDLDWVVCYQSRVGPLEWIGPATEDEIKRAGEDGKGVLLVPIAFVSEHSETLVELDIEYKELAEKEGVPSYKRMSTVGDNPSFIDALAALCSNAVGGIDQLSCAGGRRICPAMHSACPRALQN